MMIRYSLVWLLVLILAACEIKPITDNSTVPQPTETATDTPWPTATDTPANGTVPQPTETATATPWPTATPTASPTEAPRTCDGQPATIYKRLRAGTTVAGTPRDDVIVVIVGRRNSTVQIWADAGKDRVCVYGDSARIFVNGGPGNDHCEYAGISRQASIFVCEYSIWRPR